jgi:sec-independent protein translocase protein TatB
MFDIGFPELMMVSIVALLVIGPDKLPQTIRALILWIGRFKSSLANIRADIENEIGADEIRQQLHNESVMKNLGETRQQLENIIHSTDKTLSDIKKTAANPRKATIDFATEAFTDNSTNSTNPAALLKSSASLSNSTDDASATLGPDSDKTRRPDAAD